MNIKLNSTLLILLINLAFLTVDSHKMPKMGDDLLDPVIFRPYMFTQ